MKPRQQVKRNLLPVAWIGFMCILAMRILRHFAQARPSRGAPRVSQTVSRRATRKEPKSVEELLRQIMLELLYPAVLGAVLFEGLKFARHAISSINIQAIVQYDPDALIVVKCLLVALTTFFYGCDYAYIILTRKFRVGFFWYDCAFLCGLYITFVAMRIEEHELASAPLPYAIALLYLLFLIGYYSWDHSEMNDPQTTPEEKEFYLKILRWETRSFGAVALIAVLAVFIKSAVFVSCLLALVLTFVNLAFFRLVREKRDFATA